MPRPSHWLTFSLALLATCQLANGQGKKGGPQPPTTQGSALGYSSVRFVEDVRIRQVINIGRDCILDAEYKQAVQALQAVLNEKNDHHVQVTARDAANPKMEVTRWASAKHEANNLIGAMPPAGLKIYEAEYGDQARQMFDAARKKEDPASLAEVAARFRHTKAGAEAYDMFAKKFLAAATVQGNDVKDWRSWRGNAANTGQPSGSAPLLDKRLWSRPLFMDKLDGFNERDADDEAFARVNVALKQATELKQPVLPGGFPVATQNILVYRTARDIRAVTLKELMLQDENAGLFLIVKPGQILWKTVHYNRGLAIMLEKAQYRAALKPWLDGFEKAPGFSSLLYENTLLGALAADDRYVYAINDLAVPPHPAIFFANRFNPQQPNLFGQELKPFLVQNELYAYDLKTGKLIWDLTREDAEFKDSHFLSAPLTVGNKLYVLNERVIDPNQPQPNPFGGGMVNAFGGESELRLVCLEPAKIAMVNGSPKPTIVAPIQVLANVVQQDRFVQEVRRRIHGVQLAYADGVLVCPTNAGEVFGVDLMTRTLAWSYPYRESPHQPVILPGMQPFPPIPPKGMPQGPPVLAKWKASPPVIQAGKVVFTAPDADSIHCVHLRDGKLAWKRSQQKGDLYLAGVVDGRVLIVSESKIRALDLKDGSELWSIATGDLPSGQGVASKGVYYLPLKKNEVVAIDVTKGIVKSRVRGPADGALGNLVFYENMVISQSATEIAAFPQLSARLKDAQLDAAKDADNLGKLVDYGELLWKDGQVHLAMETLLKIHQRKPADPLGKRVADRLFDVLTDLMKIDFDKSGTNHVDLYKALSAAPGDATEQLARKGKFFRLVGQGYESQGKLVEALQMYRDFAALPMHSGGIASADDPGVKIPAAIWLRGRITGLFAKATPKARLNLDQKIAEEWKVIATKDDVDAIRAFASALDASSLAGREARIRLAELITDKNDKAAFLEAELALHQVLDLDADLTRGRALAALARLEEKRGTTDSLHAAVSIYRDLARRFAKEPVRGDKTGADLLKEISIDKRFQPFLADSPNPFTSARLASRELPPGTVNIGPPGFQLTPYGAATQFTKQVRVSFNPADVFNPIVRLRDVATNQDRFQVSIGRTDLNQQLFFSLYQPQINQAYHPDAHYRFYHAKGRLIVGQLGVTVCAIDGGTGKKLWDKQLAQKRVNNMGLIQTIVGNDGTPEFIFFDGNTAQKLHMSIGRIGAVQAGYVAVVGHNGLSVLNPLDGALVWQKPDVPANAHVFGDAEHVFFVEMNAGGSVGTARAVRASDGELLKVPDFANVYQTRVRELGRQILAAGPDKANFTMRLYDIIAGNNVWTKSFAAGSHVLATEDRHLAGVIEPNGNLTVLDAKTGDELVKTSVLRGRIDLQDLKDLRAPLLLADAERFYVALNQPIDHNKVMNNMIFPNFNNGTRCQPVNGWVLAIHRHDGKTQRGDREIVWKKGDFAWHSQAPVRNQMIVVDQFDQMPMLLFTSRYIESAKAGGNQWVSLTQSLLKSNGMWLYDSAVRSNGSPWYSDLRTDTKARTIDLVSNSKSVQIFVDDGKTP